MITYGPNVPVLYQRMPGLTIRVDADHCVGCGECMKACVFKGRKMVDGRAKMDQDRCLGCGRCEPVCPKRATTIDIADMSHVDGLIARIEAYVDVADQSAPNATTESDRL